jgi:hypothetical protein
MARQPQEHIPVPKLTIETIDQAIHDWFDKTVDSHVQAPNGERKKISVLFSSGERWISSRERKGVRDKNGVLILPLISIRRTGIDKGTPGGMMAMGVETENLVVSKRISPKTNLIQNAIQNRPQDMRPLQPVVYEVTTIPFPDLSVVTYDVQVQTQYILQMNSFIEKMLHELDIQKSFVMSLDDQRRHPPIGEPFENRKPFKGGYLVGFLDENLNADDNFEEFTDQERIIRFSFNIRIPAPLLLDPEGEKPSITVEKTAFDMQLGTEVVNFVDDPYDIELIFNSRDPAATWREIVRKRRGD